MNLFFLVNKTNDLFYKLGQLEVTSKKDVFSSITVF